MLSLRSVLARVLLAAAVPPGAAGPATAASEEPQGPTPVAVPALQPAEGSLQHVFSVWFSADPEIVARVTGLVAQRVARTAGGGELEVVFPRGVPYPSGEGSVTARNFHDPEFRPIFDHLALPPGIPRPAGLNLVTSYRVGFRPEFLLVWHDVRTDQYSITLLDANEPQALQPLIARSRTPIIGVAQTPSAHSADYYLTVWTLPEAGSAQPDQQRVSVESYLWQRSA